MLAKPKFLLTKIQIHLFQLEPHNCISVSSPTLIIGRSLFASDSIQYIVGVTADGASNFQ